MLNPETSSNMGAKNVLAMSNQQMLYNNVKTFSPSLGEISFASSNFR